jgi:uncharacterized membrane-anchored protein YhcB (DUF1043 family)
MSSSPQALNDLLGLVEERERAARWRVVVFSAIPVVLAAMLLWFTGERIRTANSELASVDAKLAGERARLKEAEAKSADFERQLEQVQADLRSSQEQVKTYAAQVASLQKQLQEAMDYGRNLAATDPAMLMKYVASRYHSQGRLFIDIFELQHRGVGWNAGGFSEQQGFDSPSFAAYLLERHHLLQRPASEVRYRLREVLHAKDAPEVGDLVFYSLGYTMFFCRYGEQRPFVIGMTPFGILALRVDFAQVVGYAEVPYRP